MSDPDEAKVDETEAVEEEQPKSAMEEARDEVKLDEGAASVFIGVDPEYQNYADPTHMPIVTPAEVQQFVDTGVLEVVKVGDEVLVSGNVGVVSGSGTENTDAAPGAVAEEFEGDEEVEDDEQEDGDVKEEDDAPVESSADGDSSGEEATAKPETKSTLDF